MIKFLKKIWFYFLKMILNWFKPQRYENKTIDDPAESEMLKPLINQKTVDKTDEETCVAEETGEENKLMIVNALDKTIQISNKRIELINELDTEPEIKRVLIKKEDKLKKKYERYKELVQNEEVADFLRNILDARGNRLQNVSKRNLFYEGQHDEMRKLSHIYNTMGCDRNIIDLYNDLEDLIDEQKKNTVLSIDNINPGFNGGVSTTYQIMPYDVRIYNFAKDLENLQDNPYKFYHLYDKKFDLEHLELYHMPEKYKDFTIYRDTKNHLEYIKLYNGKWQVGEYDPRVD